MVGSNRRVLPTLNRIMRAYCHGLVVVEIVVLVIEMIDIVMMMMLIV